MPIEIRELIIRAVVSEERGSVGESLEADTTVDDREAIIAACIKQVLKILQQSRDR
jgi:hypothetical protein